MDWTQIASSFASGLGSGGAPPSSAVSASPFNTSGWNFNFGDGNSTATGQADGVGQYLPFVAIAAALMIGYRMTKRKNKG